MKTPGNKGFTLIEMLLVLAIICITLPLLYQLYIYGQETFTYNSRLIAQQYAVTNVMAHIRGDVQEAASVSVASQNSDTGHELDYPKTITLKLGYVDPKSPDNTGVVKFKYWRFYCRAYGEEGVLQYSGEKNPDEIVSGPDDYSTVVAGLDIMGCDFYRANKSEALESNYLTIQIKPMETNKGKAGSRNVKEPIRTEISVLYKDIL